MNLVVDGFLVLSILIRARLLASYKPTHCPENGVCYNEEELKMVKK
jgi:hypothetical protein